jgi:hypothetical protein
VLSSWPESRDSDSGPALASGKGVFGKSKKIEGTCLTPRLHLQDLILRQPVIAKSRSYEAGQLPDRLCIRVPVKIADAVFQRLCDSGLDVRARYVGLGNVTDEL